MNTIEETLTVVDGAMSAGASGVVFGRNIWQSKHPGAMVRALQSIIHKRSSVAEALDYLK
jgi:DhnA family fructose-bisphosphate aldolase class Ia